MGKKPPETTTPVPKLEVWKRTQEKWDDSEFLGSLTPLMRWRYERLDEAVAGRLKHGLEGKPKPLLVDMGCGRGEFHDFLARGPKPSWQYLGVEPSTHQIKNRLEPLPGLGIVRAAGENLPLPDMCADAVLLKEVLDHAYDAQRLLKEAFRILKPGGVFVLTVTNDRSYYKRLLPGENAKRKSRQKDHLNFYGPAEVELLMKIAPFDRVSVETYNYLKLPSFLEGLIGLPGPAFGKGLIALADNFGKALMPGLGGGIIVEAFRPKT